MTHASSDIRLIKPWIDTHTAAKAKVAVSLETIKRQALWRAAHKSRQEAIERGAPRYTGRPCRHRDHAAERYSVCGGCVACAREGAERRRRLRGAAVRGAMPQARHECRSERRAAARSRRQEECGAGIGWTYRKSAQRASD
jgi:hypothetical protein